MTKKNQQPSITETAFDCPHCGAYTTQYWHEAFAQLVKEKQRIPFLITKESYETAKKNITEDKEIDQESWRGHIDWMDKMVSGFVFLDHNEKSNYNISQAQNLYLSKCYNCKRFSIWVKDHLLFPPQKSGPNPNHDLSENIIHDFEEARSILNLSPRGTAALLRLCIQKLCIHLGEKGRKIDDDIGSLVSKGLNPLIQKSLDVVRVIGNEAVHPGIIDLKDDRDTALKLFDLINLIADQMITHPKTVDLMYEKIPPEKRKAIEDRNDKATKKS